MLSAYLLHLTGKHTQDVATAVRTSFIEVGVHTAADDFCFIYQCSV